MKQLVLSGNRVIAHGEDCFLPMGGTVICPDTGKVYQNATLAVCEGGIPADIDEVGYEYRAGEFVPCAPYGKGTGNIAVVCNNDCKSIKDSGISSEKVRNVSETGLTLSYLPNIEMPGSGYDDIAYGNGIFIATTGETTGAYSKGGDVWELISFPAQMSGVTYGDGKFVAVGNDSAACSTDGITWTAATLPSSFDRGVRVAYGGGMFVAIENGHRTAYSEDGISWTSGGNSANSSSANKDIIYGDGKFVVASDGSSSAPYIFCSTDGINWTKGTCTFSFISLTYAAEMFVGITSDGKVYYTTDPTGSWTKTGDLASATWKAIDYNNGVFVAISEDKYAARSTDGINWGNTSLPNDYNLAAITHNEERFIAVGGGTKALDYTSGEGWRVRGAYRFRLPSGEDVTNTVKAILT